MAKSYGYVHMHFVGQLNTYMGAKIPYGTKIYKELQSRKIKIW